MHLLHHETILLSLWYQCFSYGERLQQTLEKIFYLTLTTPSSYKNVELTKLTVVKETKVDGQMMDVTKVSVILLAI